VSLPLAGLTVLDLTRLLPGGLCSLLLADFGAEVTKVEDTAAGDYLRWTEPRLAGADPSAAATAFVALNRNKRSVRIDLKTAGGRDALLGLVERADVVLESFRPGVMQRLGLDYAVLSERNPTIVHCSITGYGQDSPWRERAGHDLNYIGLVGALALGGEVGGAPAQPATQLADVGGAMLAAFGILVALRERDASGEGQHVDVSMADAALAALAMVAGGCRDGQPPPRRGELALAGGAVCYRPYRCVDGWVTIGALEPKFWEAWCRGVGREDLIDRQYDPPGSPAHAAVAEVFSQRTRAEWQGFAARHDCCVEPVLELDEALASAHVAARDMVVEVGQPGAAAPARALGPPVKLSRTPADPRRRPAPALGEHTDEVLAAAGFTEEQRAGLRDAHAVAGAGGAPAPAFLGGERG
jgi:alpha-methylacyl-CoA racemase